MKPEPARSKRGTERPGFQVVLRCATRPGVRRLWRGDPEEIASTVIWLGSEDASYVTGQSITVDGGYSVQERCHLQVVLWVASGLWQLRRWTMEEASPSAVATQFLQRFSNGGFDDANELIHPEGPLEGAGDVAMLVSMLATDFLAPLILGAVPTEVTETTIIEEGPSNATVEAHLDIASLVTIQTIIELRPADFDENDPGDGRRDGWEVWNVTTSP